MTKALIIQPDGTGAVEDFDANDYPTLSRKVGGMIEAVMVDDTVHAYVNEEGKLQGLAPNPIATLLTGVHRWGDFIVGPAVFLSSNPDGTEADLPDGWYTEVAGEHECDFCGPHSKAVIDGKTRQGPWADMCAGHFLEHGVGLGLGVGQWIVPVIENV